MTDAEIVERIGPRPTLLRDLSSARAIAKWELARALLYPDPGRGLARREGGRRR